jgi:penicillin-binding protein 1A
MAHRFGVTTNIPAYLPIALGAVEITLEEQVASYSVFPNDGIRVKPRMIRRVKNADGITLWEDAPAVTQVIDQDTARTMLGLLRAVTRMGTGAAAAQLNHPLGGKTGTTSDYTDAWFLGFSPSVTCGVWVGYDSNESLGEKETGARAALPIWMTVMRTAIVGKDDEQFLGDEKETPMLKAAAAAPRPAKSEVAATERSVLKSPPQLAVKLTVQPTAGIPSAKLRVKTALSSQPTRVKPAPTVKPEFPPIPSP